MESFADCLREVLEDGALTFPESGELDLIEDDPNSKQTVKLTNAPPDLLAVDVRKIGKISELDGFKRNGWKQSCDYLLVFQDNGNERALFIELKATLSKKNRSKGQAQFRWSRPVLDYLRSIYEVRNKARPGSIQLSAGCAIISEKIGDSDLSKRYVNLEPGEPTPEPYENIDVSIVVGAVVSWRKLRGIQEAGASAAKP